MSPYKNGGPFGVIRYGRKEMVQHEAELADGADDVEPGMLVERVGDGGDVYVQPHSTEGTVENAYVAIEARGRGMNADDGVYSHDDDGDTYVRYVKASGGGLNLRLSGGEDVSIGDSLTSDGSGYLKVYASADDDDFGFAAEMDQDNSGGDAGDEFVAAEVSR